MWPSVVAAHVLGVVAHKLSSCGTWAELPAGIWNPGQGINLCPLHWQANSYPLRHQGSPSVSNFKTPKLYICSQTYLSMCILSYFLMYKLATWKIEGQYSFKEYSVSGI